jgi:2-polyprenyl-6-methoxyphenol hydroxylase-like FAD-dependent oxidoreductase
VTIQHSQARIANVIGSKDRGQGLNNAIDDAAQLVQQLKDVDPGSPRDIIHAIDRYDAEVQKRGKAAVLSSLENSLTMHDWSKLQQSLILTRGIKKDEH